MGLWIPVVARVTFYAGTEAATSPRWLCFGGRRFQVGVLHQVRLASREPGGEMIAVWLVQVACGAFRVRVQSGHVTVERWVGKEPPRGLADLLA